MKKPKKQQIEKPSKKVPAPAKRSGTVAANERHKEDFDRLLDDATKGRK